MTFLSFLQELWNRNISTRIRLQLVKILVTAPAPALYQIICLEFLCHKISKKVYLQTLFFSTVT